MSHQKVNGNNGIRVKQKFFDIRYMMKWGNNNIMYFPAHWLRRQTSSYILNNVVRDLSIFEDRTSLGTAELKKFFPSIPSDQGTCVLWFPRHINVTDSREWNLLLMLKFFLQLKEEGIHKDCFWIVSSKLKAFNCNPLARQRKRVVSC
jgi:hypothetical protein